MLKFDQIQRFSITQFSITQGNVQFSIQEIGYKPGYIIRLKETYVIVSKEEIVAMREYIANYNPYKSIPPFILDKRMIFHINWENPDDMLPRNWEFKIGGNWIQIKPDSMLLLTWYLMRI